MPTAFRSAPINYAATEKFTENQSELMFFGISGYEVETLLVNGADSCNDKNMLMHPSLLLPIEMKLSQTCADDSEMSEIAHVDQVQVRAVRCTNPHVESLPPSAILTQETGLTRLVGIAETEIEFDERLMLLGDLRIDLKLNQELESKGWEFSGLNVKFESYPVDQAVFVNQTLDKQQSFIRESLVGLRS